MKYLKLLIILFIFSSCSKNIYKISKREYNREARKLGKTLIKINPDTIKNQKIDVLKSQNFSLRKPNLIVIHHTDQDSCQETFKTFALKRTQVSSHYVICDNGNITQMLNDLLRGWHAGGGSWGKNTDINSVSIGIELDNNGEEPFSDAQINSLILLLQKLTEKYKIPMQNIVGHADIAPGRKVDPSALFPWEKLAENGFGIWYDETKIETTEVPENFDTKRALKFIGYNIANIEDAIFSFKLHFNPTGVPTVLSKKDQKILFLLLDEL
jgi:N-acetylmuramoyl-L-alanine amidase